MQLHLIVSKDSISDTPFFVSKFLERVRGHLTTTASNITSGEWETPIAKKDTKGLTIPSCQEHLSGARTAGAAACRGEKAPFSTFSILFYFALTLVFNQQFFL